MSLFMSQISKIKLNSSCVLTVPLQVYNNDFSFIVNGEEFKTSKLISDLLSPIICQIHLNDPTFDLFIINTHETGNFSQILDLLSFKQNNLPDNELSFILEVLEILDNQSIEFNESNEAIELTVDNIFSFIKEHEKHPKFYNDRLHQEIEFVSSHFNELWDAHEEEFEKISLLTLNSIFENEKLKLESEDLLLRIVNKLYMKDVKYSILYETILFENVSVEAMKDFISIYDNNDMTASVWRQIDCGDLNGKSFVHTFKMKNETSNEYRYVRMRLTGPNWNGNNKIFIDSFEIYGILV